MKKRNKSASRILTAVRETVRDLKSAGFITKHKMKAEAHPLFGLEKADKRGVAKIVDELRKPRHAAF